MKVTYIHHSGFLVETDNFYYIFDYYTGTVPRLDKSKKVIVFSSHSHADHYNPEIFNILSSMGMYFQTVLAKDISPKKYPEGVSVTKAYANKTYEIENIIIETLQSTDAGVAFIVRDPEGVIYHSGDLNDWAWDGEPEQYNRQMTGSYRHEINKLANEKIDIAFAVLDPRQEKNYADGMLYLLKKVNVKKVYPMHYWNQPDIIKDFLLTYPQYSDIIVNTEENKGE